MFLPSVSAEQVQLTEKPLNWQNDFRVTSVAIAFLNKQDLSIDVRQFLENSRQQAKEIDNLSSQNEYIIMVNKIFNKILSHANETATTSTSSSEIKAAGIEFLLREYYSMNNSASNCKTRIFQLIKESLGDNAKALSSILNQEPVLDEALKKIKNQAEFILKPKFFSSKKDWIFWNTRFSQVLDNSLGKMATSSGSLTAVLAGAASIQVGIYYAYNNLGGAAAINVVVGAILIGSQLGRAAKAAFEGNYEIL